jgi:heptosyltransferase-2
MKILVIGPSWVGDMMMSQSLYRTLKQRWPEATIDVMAPAWCRPLLSRMPEVNEALAMPLGHGALALGERRRLGRSLRDKGYDRAYVLPNSFKSALVPFFADIQTRTGWRGEMRYGLLNDIRVLDKAAFPLMVERYVALAYDKAQIASASDLPQPLLWPKLLVNEQEKQETAAAFRLSAERPLIGFCPGAEFGPAKRWPHYHYAALAQQLIDSGYQIALYGPSSPDFTPPLSHKARVIRLITGYHKVRKGDAEEGYHQSLIDIKPQRVAEELSALLGQPLEAVCTS